tara:strand:+ start:1414 stop:1776 length:363 start_codon:yes stop_codon:yes gene_type:complete
VFELIFRWKGYDCVFVARVTPVKDTRIDFKHVGFVATHGPVFQALIWSEFHVKMELPRRVKEFHVLIAIHGNDFCGRARGHIPRAIFVFQSWWIIVHFFYGKRSQFGEIVQRGFRHFSQW